MSDDRPIYVGVGSCKCGRVEVKLFRLPNATILDPLACTQCLGKAGYEAPRSRTADDIEDVGGKLSWRKT